MDYKEVELHNRKIRYFNEEHIEMEYQNIKNNWRRVSIYKQSNYLAFNCNAKTIYIHRFVFWINNPSWDIYDISRSNLIDHFDGNTTNNKIENLSCVTNQENCWNKTKAKGYCWHKKSQKWQAEIKVNYKTIYLGTFENKEDARDAYLKAKLEYHVIKPKSFV